ncbi:hypothetical protein OUZ56_013952 [Daphnia magna]|uniref:Uncharacterized protein n=1 Tax=Daphnia magna TaxID=35525 RepID=A0ABQ9Z7F5_9CRUS|nr:hypothetical protein OUZ56_013952 [Daphnia magna]
MKSREIDGRRANNSATRRHWHRQPKLYNRSTRKKNLYIAGKPLALQQRKQNNQQPTTKSPIVFYKHIIINWRNHRGLMTTYNPSLSNSPLFFMAVDSWRDLQTRAVSDTPVT